MTEFKPGDKVRNAGRHGKDKIYIILAIDGNAAWLKDETGRRFTTASDTVELVPDFFEVGKTYVSGVNEKFEAHYVGEHDERPYAAGIYTLRGNSYPVAFVVFEDAWRPLI